jgi:hypothetical protein
MAELAVAVSLKSVGAPAAHEHTGTHIMDSCLADCYRCGMHNRVFAVTDQGVVSRCYSCEDGWECTTPPWSCQHPHGFGPVPRSPSTAFLPPQ